MVGPQSWLVFKRLGLLEVAGGMDWLKVAVRDWDNLYGYNKFKDFVENLTIVNDPAEQGVKLIQDFVESAQKEDVRQDLMLSVCEESHLSIEVQ